VIEKGRRASFLIDAREAHTIIDSTGDYVEIESVRLDDYLADKGFWLDVVKMDIEGAAPRGRDQRIYSAGTDKMTVETPYLVLTYNPETMK
jgi:hypothetical protein